LPSPTFEWKAAQHATLVTSPDNRAISDSIPGITVLDVARDGLAFYATADSTLFIGKSAALFTGPPPQTGGFRILESDAWGWQLGPGGEWITYTAGLQEVGDWRVYLAHTRPPFEHWRVSPGSGEEPVWNPAGELVYREGNRWMRIAARWLRRTPERRDLSFQRTLPQRARPFTRHRA
jgi:hypothetical protein